jgi:hypothetical protein
MAADQPTLFGEPPLPIPIARWNDWPTSHLAAQKMRKSAPELHRAIHEALFELGEATQFEIAERVLAARPHRWTEATIRTACKRAGLVETGRTGYSPTGSPAKTWRLP